MTVQERTRQSTRRRFVRIPLDVPTFVDAVDGRVVSPPLRISITNISEDGVAALSREAIADDAAVVLRVPIHHGEELRFDGVVRWSHGQGPVHLGFQFTEIDSTKRDRLADYLDRVVSNLSRDDVSAEPAWKGTWSDLAFQALFVFFFVLAVWLYFGTL